MDATDGSGIDDVMVAAAIGDLDLAESMEALPPATLAALRLADLLTSDEPFVSPELYDAMKEHFSDGQVLELGSALAVASGWQRFIEAFGIRPDADQRPDR